MALTPQDWHRRFTQQAAWTAELRWHLFKQAGLVHTKRIIEIGCGTGAILKGIPSAGPEVVAGLDIDAERLALVHQSAPKALLTQADGHKVPFVDAAFDGVFCHYLLLWVRDPRSVIAEMVRVTRPGGAVFVLAEPDYGGRIDHPEPLQRLGHAQTVALRRQGADPELGRQLSSLLVEAGLNDVRGGVLGGRWSQPPGPNEQALEWAVLEADLAGVIPSTDLDELRELDHTAWQRRERILYVPTFYAWGNKKEA